MSAAEQAQELAAKVRAGLPYREAYPALDSLVALASRATRLETALREIEGYGERHRYLIEMNDVRAIARSALEGQKG